MTYPKKQPPKKPDLINLGLGKIPPQALELEEAVIGACMIEKGTFETVMEIISDAEVFYLDAHRLTYAAMCVIYNEGSPVDLLTVSEQLRKTGELEKVGGAHYLSRLTMSVISSAHAKQHAQIVFEKYALRETIRICGETIVMAYESSADPFECQEEAVKLLNGLFDGVIAEDSISIGAASMEVMRRYDIQKQTKSPLIGIDTGFNRLNRVLGGFTAPSLVFIAGFQSQGKTALMLEMVRKCGQPCEIYSLETAAQNLASRMMAAESRVSFEHLRKGTLDEFSEDIIRKSLAKFQRRQINITYKLSFIEDIEKDIRHKKKKNPNLKLIFVDFIQIVELRYNTERLDSFGRIGYVSRVFKKLAQQLGLCIIALSQLNRETKKNENKRPEASNLAGSSELERNADVILAIHYQTDGNTGNTEPWLLVLKNKDGRCEDLHMRFDGDFQQWGDFEDSHIPAKLPSGVLASQQFQENPRKWDDDVWDNV